jgi:hypothetical protein
MRVIVISSSDGLEVVNILETCLATHTYRPISYSLDAMGDISEWIVIMPSKGRSGGGFTILASTCAMTLRER